MMVRLGMTLNDLQKNISVHKMNPIQMHVGVGPSFFKKSFNDYSNWRWAIVREALQNSMDAPHSKNIEVTFQNENGNTVFFWCNDGDPMSEDILINKFMTLGESGKDFQNGAIGGFGKAKELLVMCHLNYEITTGDCFISGSGGNYTLEKCDYYPGTMTKVTIEGDVVELLTFYLTQLLSMSQWHGSVKVNGKEWIPCFRKGSRRREFDWGIVYTNKTVRNRLVVRMHGIPMFYRQIDCNGRCVVVELKTGNSDVLQSNRDSLKFEYQQQLNSFIDEITTNNLSALKEDKPIYTCYAGNKIKLPTPKVEMQRIVSALLNKSAIFATNKQSNPSLSKQSNLSISKQNPLINKSKIDHEFIIKNSTGMEIPTYYLPSEFSEYSAKLAKTWIQILLTLYELFNKTDEFSVGFVFGEETEAEFDDSQYGNVYLINPVIIKKQGKSKSRSMTRRYKFNAAGRWSIVANALHEFVHGAMCLTTHNELFSSTLTDAIGVVLNEKKRFNHCFV